jgi:transcriptional regulator with XRE-family HTH domain
MAGNQDSAHGARLRRERELRGWSQADVADRIGAPSPFHVSRWERGVVTPSPRYRQRYCTLFDKTVVQLGFVDPTVDELIDKRSRADVADRPVQGPARLDLPWAYTCPDCGRSIPLAHILPTTAVEPAGGSTAGASGCG